MSKDPPFPDCKQILTSEKLLPLAFTLTFTVLAYCHCHWACDLLVSLVLDYNLIICILDIFCIHVECNQLFTCSVSMSATKH